MNQPILRRSPRNHPSSKTAINPKDPNIQSNVGDLIDEITAKKSLPTEVKPYKFVYGKSGKGVPKGYYKTKGRHIDPYKLKAKIIAYRISLRQALKDPDSNRSESAKTAMREELKQLMDMGTFEAARYDKLTEAEKRHVIPSHLFFKDKYKGDGAFDKFKARLVAGYLCSW